MAILKEKIVPVYFHLILISILPLMVVSNSATNIKSFKRSNSKLAYCGKPPEIDNSFYILENVDDLLPVGTKIYYTCHDGSVLNKFGNDYAECIDANGTSIWVSPNIHCIPGCNNIPILSNARLKLEGRAPPFNVGESINYTCNPGYVSEQRYSQVTCSIENGIANWTYSDAGCKIIFMTCNDPGDIENADRIGHVFTYPHNITYVCNEGYRLIGSATRYCSPTGQWIPARPICEAIVCPLLSDPQNGKVISSQRRLHAVATYECNRHFNLSGNLDRVCQEDSTWSGDMPTCKEITCFDPGVFQNMRSIPQKPFHKAGDLVIFKCKYSSYKTTSKCLESGEWSVRPILCPEPSTTDFSITTMTSPLTEEAEEDLGIAKKAACDDPGKIKNGERILVGLSINSTITYTCDEGYDLRGKSTLLCMENGKWDLDKLPICVKPLSVPSIIGIVLGVIIFIGLGISGYFWYKWRMTKIRGFGDKSKALTADATDLDEISGLESGKKHIPVTVL